ncbi:hypothetical protein ACH3XW_43815 [Acanthocheilonema viteae]
MKKVQAFGHRYNELLFAREDGRIDEGERRSARSSPDPDGNKEKVVPVELSSPEVKELVEMVRKFVLFLC